MSDKLQRTIARFQAKIDNGSFYEAHQTLRTIANRAVHSKQYSQATDLLYQGALILAQKKEYASASDLTSYLLSVYKEAGETTTKENRMKLIELLSLFPDNEASLVDLSKQSIEWSQTDSNKFGDAELHTFFGVKLLRGLEAASITKEEGDKLFAYAELHLILGTSDAVPVYVGYLKNWYQSAQKENAEVDPGVFLSRAVLNYAYLRNVKFAQESIDLFADVLGASETVEGVPFSSQYPLVNFLRLLVKTLCLTSENGSKFLKLYSQYKGLLTETKLIAPIEYLGKVYFNLQLGNPNQQNMLANLMGGLFK